MPRMMNGKYTNCPNCGAPIEHYYNYQCKYCKTFLHNTDEEIKKIKNTNIHFRNVEIEKDFLSRDILITIYGITFPKAHWYEEGIGEIVLSGDSVSLGTPVAFRIKIPFNLYYKSYNEGSFNEILEYIDYSLPGIYEDIKYRIFDEIIEKMYNRTLF